MHFPASLACLALLHQAVGVPVPVLAPTGGIPPAAPPAANMNGPSVISDVPPPIPVQGQIKSSNGLPTAPNPNAVATTGKSNALATAPKPNIGPTAPNPNVMGVNPGLTPGMGDDEYGDDEYGDDDLDPGYDDPMNPSNGLPTGGSSGPKLPDYGNTQLAGPTGTKPPDLQGQQGWGRKDQQQQQQQQDQQRQQHQQHQQEQSHWLGWQIRWNTLKFQKDRCGVPGSTDINRSWLQEDLAPWISYMEQGRGDFTI
ncbi:hypothetical protein MGG_07609 [Pyricularia oryzae 70-15]|uniref:Uncharacterized protein n=3 Tax=Pyricularia oryzae TaxID=318829 RepID=G4N2L4_PYRO7|nr:uncharacterized protein MGG_07609 [Pyricularia oryzae 70-15]EHA51723.1 hypothetical protein MGG_07609 [Pyricularia oryzae 70-15]ELQ35281.1 hypothetical protein OOU_Y34scaffold00719g45 [Pyricularia oryzae Y34]